MYRHSLVCAIVHRYISNALHDVSIVSINADAADARQ